MQKSTPVRNCTGVFVALQQVGCLKMQKIVKSRDARPLFGLYPGWIAVAPCTNAGQPCQLEYLFPLA